MYFPGGTHMRWRRTRSLILGVGLSALLASGCDSAEREKEDAEEEEVTNPTYLNADRPARLYVPSDYDAEKAYPLVLMLHGYSVTGAMQNVIFQLVERVKTYQFILVVPEGTRNQQGHPFWNAFEDCCNFYGQDVDDVAYLTGLVEEAAKHVHVDRSRVTTLGHSNGGYMSLRLACERPDIFSRAVSVAGSMPSLREQCDAEGGVSILQIHGTEDITIPYENNLETEGGDGHGIFTRGAEATVQDWVDFNGCSPEPVESTRADFMSIAGDETVITRWDCGEGVSVQLWRIEGGDHLLLSRKRSFQNQIAEFVTAP